MLSNAVHSGLTDVWLVEQYEPYALNDHLANGRPWDLDRTHGGLQVLPPFQGERGEGFADGNADALLRQARFIRNFAPDVVLVASADHLYRCDFRDVLDAHADSGAVATIVTTEVDEDASRYAVVTAGPDGRVSRLDDKPDEPAHHVVATEIFAYEPTPLLETLEGLAQRGPLGDYGDELLPELIATQHVHEFRLEGYWRDVGTIDAYFDAHMEMLDPSPPFSLDDPDWPILSAKIPRRPAYVGESARVRTSLLANGCMIDGEVEHAVLGPGVRVERGASVRNAVLLGDVVVPEGAVVDHAIVDEGVLMKPGERVGSPGEVRVITTS